ncbi:hypothetical protein G6O67_006290 [Ophiocordyceps sinensis]|uniref:Uncharacterized protein n=1 Tax=Ophiocordyceps sinensis TaxID=72228 RepID=A0A8H4PMV2_9HYPO|nr:hypothetical protein G6O67_006290 [Ophiocordyceps sinensis]
MTEAQIVRDPKHGPQTLGWVWAALAVLQRIETKVEAPTYLQASQTTTLSARVDKSASLTNNNVVSTRRQICKPHKQQRRQHVDKFASLTRIHNAEVAQNFLFWCDSFSLKLWK